MLLLMADLCYAQSDWRCSGAHSIEVELTSTTISGIRKPTPHGLERSLLLFRVCPARAYGVLDRDGDVLDGWLESLDMYARSEKARTVLQQFKQVLLTQQTETNDRLPAIILSHLEEIATSKAQGDALLQSALSATIEDWEGADGEFRIWLSDDLLFLLSIDPTLFYRVMSTNRALLAEWLRDMPDLSFAGLPENKEPSDNFRSRLIVELRSHKTDPELVTIKRAIISRLRCVKYSAIE